MGDAACDMAPRNSFLRQLVSRTNLLQISPWNLHLQEATHDSSFNAWDP